MRLGDICTKIGSGATPRGGKESYKESGTPIIRSQNVLDWAFRDDGLAYIDDEQAEALANVEVMPGDVLLNITGDSVARACIVPTELMSARVNQHVAIVRHGDMLNPTYLLAFLQSIKPRLLALASSGATRKALTKAMIEDLEIELPDMETQQRVSSVIEAIQRKIALNSNINGYLKALASTAYRAFIETLGGNYHEGTMSELLEIRYGKDHKRLTPGNVPVYGSGGLMRKVDSSLYSGESVLIPRKGSLNNVMYVDEAFWTVDTMFYTVPKEPGAAKYCYQFLCNQDLASMNSGSAVPSMTIKILDALPIKVPTNRALETFNDEVAPLYSAVKQFQIENERLSSLRETLLPRLMSGEIDISKIEVPAPPNSHFARC
jgi:type I restriction enzyme S subunit